MKRKLPYFTIYSTDFCAYTRHLTKAQIGELVCAINDVALGYEKPKLSEKIEKVWKIFEDRLIEDLDKYKAKIERSQKGGAARGKQQADRKHSQPEPEPEKEREKESTHSKRGTRLDVTFFPPEWIDFCRAERPDLDPVSVFKIFRDHWVAAPGQKGVKTDWPATWRNWVRREKGATKSMQAQQPKKTGVIVL